MGGRDGLATRGEVRREGSRGASDTRVNAKTLLRRIRHGLRGSTLAWKLVLDAVVIAGGATAAYFARFEAVPQGVYATQAAVVVPLLALLRVGTSWSAGLYRRSWRYTGLRDALQLGLLYAAWSILLLGVRLIAPSLSAEFTPIPLSVIGLEGLFAIAGGVGVRALVRTSDERSSRRAHNLLQKPQQRALLIGAGRAGCHTARELYGRPDVGYEVVGFLDDDPGRIGQVVAGYEVLGTTRDLARVAAETQTELAILTLPSLGQRELREIITRCRDAELPVHTIPALPELLGRRVPITQIQPVQVSELLGRAEVSFCTRSWGRVLAACRNRRVLVTGAGGSIGSELCRQLAELHPERLILLDNNENNLFDIDNEIRARTGTRGIACLADIRRRDDLERVFREHQPQVVFHTAAYKHVPMMEFHPCAAIQNNVMGTRLLVETADAHEVERFVMISTDKAVRPTNVMGATKQVAEKIVQAMNPRSDTHFCCVRFGNVLGSRGSVLHTFQSQLSKGGPITVTHPEITRFFMTIPEAVRLVIQAMAVSSGGELFLLEMGEPIRILDLARQMVEFSGLQPDHVPIVFTGLRPGEKLHEELVYENEDTAPSVVEGLLMARGVQPDTEATTAAVAELEDAAHRDDAALVRDLLAEFTQCEVLAHTRPLKVAN